MASIDEAYLDMTGTERLHGPPLEAAHKLHAAVKRETGLNCSIGVARRGAITVPEELEPVRLLGVQASSLEAAASQATLLYPDEGQRWHKALAAADKLRDRYGESALSLAAGMKGAFRERVQENPASLPGKRPRKREP
jgi:hypothetical protein